MLLQKLSKISIATVEYVHIVPFLNFLSICEAIFLSQSLVGALLICVNINPAYNDNRKIIFLMILNTFSNYVH